MVRRNDRRIQDLCAIQVQQPDREDQQDCSDHRGGWAYLLTAPSYNLGNDGGKRFCLERVEDRTGLIKLCKCSKTGTTLRCTNKGVVSFIRGRLRLAAGENLVMRAKEVDGVLMFGVLDSDAR